MPIEAAELDREMVRGGVVSAETANGEPAERREARDDVERVQPRREEVKGEKCSSSVGRERLVRERHAGVDALTKVFCVLGGLEHQEDSAQHDAGEEEKARQPRAIAFH